MKRDRAGGQVLVLFALMLVVLLGFAALAIDVSSVYSEMRFERAVADAASLAGASDTYRDGSTTVGAPEWRNARTHAMQNLMDELSPTFVAGDPTLGVLPSCGGPPPPYDNDIVNCPVPGTPFYVSVFAPAPSCAAGACDPLRSVQVTVRNPRHGLTFARLFSQQEWNLAVTSVAERNRGTNYSFVTLRPPKPSRANSPWCTPNCDANDENIVLDGTNTRLSVLGDMGTNTNMKLTAGAMVVLSDPGSFVDRYDAYKLWSGPPPDRQIPAPIPDPDYPIPVRPTDVLLTYADAVAAHMTSADCATEVGLIPAPYAVSAAEIATGEVVCLKPGLYQYAPGGTGYAGVTTIVLSPGVYFFDQGFMPGNNVRVIGGYEPASPGVALVFRDGGSCPFPGNCDFAGNSVDLLALNAGDAYPNGNSGTAATGAVNWDGTVVETTGRVPIPMSLIVEKDGSCAVGPTDTSACGTAANQNHQLSLPGSGSIHVFGVQYAPTDNVSISGGSGANGFLGQMWAWTVQYTGGSNINLIGAQNPEPGVLRIATPCSPSATCTNPEATVVIP
jgi:hypothetical protein